MNAGAVMEADIDYAAYSEEWTALRANCQWTALRREAMAVLRLPPRQAEYLVFMAWLATVGPWAREERCPLGLRRVEPSWRVS